MGPGRGQDEVKLRRGTPLRPPPCPCSHALRAPRTRPWAQGPAAPCLSQQPCMASCRRSSMLRLQWRLGRLLLCGGTHTCGDRTAVWPVMPRAPCVQECRAPNPGCSSDAQDGGQGLLRLCTASPHREALPAPARHLARRAAPHVESTAEAVASTSDRKWHQSLLGARRGGQAIVVSLK